MKKMKIIVLMLIAMVLVSGCSCSKKVNKYTVTFDSNGGTIVMDAIVNENELVAKPDDPKKDGYTFVGWFLNNRMFNFNTKITKNITLKARWNKYVCDITCDEDEHIGDDCTCIKNSNMTITSISLDKTALTLEVGKKVTLNATVKPSDLPFVELKWTSSNSEVVTINNGVVNAKKVGDAIITVSNGDVKTSIKVTVVDSKSKTITKAINTITSKKITKGNTSINFNYSGCIITNTDNKLSSNISKTTIDNGKITLLYRSVTKGTITSDYTIKCGSDVGYKNGVIHEVVASPYTYQATMQDVVYIINVNNAKDYTLDGHLKYRESRDGVQTGINNYTKGNIYELIFDNDQNTIYEVKEA